MVDIHAHILPFLDDGSASIELSLEMLKKEVSLGVTDVILTPHYRFEYKYPRAQTQKVFTELVDETKKLGLKINLYLGQEIYIDRNYKAFFDSDERITLNDTKYVLIEFGNDKSQEVLDVVYELVRIGYKPIIAHLERYSFAELELAYQVKEYGGLIQVNASSILSFMLNKEVKLVKQLFKHGLVDFVASDCHSFRENLMAKSYNRVLKNYGKAVAEKVFTENAQQIIRG